VLDHAAEAAVAIGSWMFTHPVATGVLFTAALVAAGAAGFWYETRRGDRS
jgi:hypothetical protein